MIDIIYIKLVGLHRAEFGKAANFQSLVFYMQILITALSIITVFINNEVFVYIASISALGATFVWAYFDWNYKKTRATAERGRRVTLLARGLGVVLSDKECRDLLASFSVSAEEGKKCEDPNYYANVGAVGPMKLAGMLQESAFWSKHLLSASSTRYWYYFIGMAVLFVILLLVFVPFLDNKDFIVGAKILTIMLTLLVSNDILGRALAYGGAASEVDKVYDRLEHIQSSSKPQDDLLFIFGDYNAAVEGAPMIASGIYDSKKDKLNELWLTVTRI